MTQKRKHPLARCEDCPLADEKGYVPSTAPQGAATAIVAEAPGRHEAKAGRPFVGQSGQLVNALMEANGLARGACVLTNAVACRPKGNATPGQEAIDACRPRLMSELESVDTIITLGSVAASAVTNDPDAKVTKLRVGGMKRLNGKRWLPTLHPAAALRAPDTWRTIEKDFEKLHRSNDVWTVPKYKVLDTPYQGILALGQISQITDIVSLDIETPFDKDLEFDHARSLLCVGIGYGKGKVAVFGKECFTNDDFLTEFKGFCSKTKLICHNGKFDLGTLYTLKLISSVRLHFDTMLASYCIDERAGGHGLKVLGQEILGADDWAIEYSNINDMPNARLWKYNAIDCAVTWDLYEHYVTELERESQRGLHDFLCKISDALSVSVEQKGLSIDQVYQQRIAKDLTERIDAKLELLHEYVDNPNSWQQIQAKFVEWGIKSKSTDKDHIAALLHCCKYRTVANPLRIRFDKSPRLFKHWKELERFLKSLQEFKRLSKYYGTYVKGNNVRMKDGVIYSTIALHTTTTGRTSSRNPNVQNIPRPDKESDLPNLRRMFVPSHKDRRFVQVDYAGAELRVVCCLSRDENMAAILRDNDRDLMSEVALDFFGKDFNKEQRTLAKAVVHGINYGRTKVGLALGMGITEDEAQHYIDAYMAKFPKLKLWHDSVHRTVFESDDYLITPFGRKRRFALITPYNRDDIANEALAFQPQSIASDICMSAMIKLVNYGLDVRLPVHDSIMVECHKGQVVPTALHMQSVMQQTAIDTFSDYVPFPCDIESGTSWGELT